MTERTYVAMYILCYQNVRLFMFLVILQNVDELFFVFNNNVILLIEEITFVAA